MVRTTTDTLSQLDSTSPEQPESEKDYYHVPNHNWRGGTYFVYPLAGFKAMIVDKGVKQVGYHRNDPVSVDVLRRDVRVCKQPYRQNRYATLTGVQDVFQICEVAHMGQ
jgi:hypothetical protein